MIPLQLVRRYAHNQQVAFEVADQEIVLHYALGLLNQAQLVGRDHRCPPTPPNVSAEASNRPERSNHSPTPTPTTTPRPPHTNFTPSSPRSVDPGSDGKTQDAVIRNIEVIGQAVKGVSEDTRALEPSAPWRQIAGMRDKVIHEYFGVDLIVLW